jgi:hypothetical protein
MPDDDRIRELWADDRLMTKEVASKLGLTMTTLYRESKRLGLPKRYSGKRQVCELDPSPEEIEIRAAAVRAGWSMTERRRRTPVARWRPPAYHFAGNGHVIQS